MLLEGSALQSPGPDFLRAFIIKLNSNHFVVYFWLRFDNILVRILLDRRTFMPVLPDTPQNNKKILITGSKGVIGGILTNSLSDSFDIYGLDIVGEQNDRHYQADISDYEALDAAFGKIENLKYVIHLAANSAPDADWKSILKNNIIGTRNVYECARKYRIKKIIFASSNHVTGGYEIAPLNSSNNHYPKVISIKDPIRPTSNYALSKAFGEAIARQYFELYGIETICLRIGRVSAIDHPTYVEGPMKPWLNPQRLARIWLSHKDLTQLVKKSILSDVKFGIYYGISNNKGKFWDISNATEELGYEPQDDASLIIARVA